MHVSTRHTLAANTNTVTIQGSGFDTTPGNNLVTFNSASGAAGVVTGATATSLTVTFTAVPTAGSLTAIVTTDGVASGTTGVQVATITPVVTASTVTSLAANAATMTINGFGFSTTPANNLVTFNGQAVVLARP